MCGVHTATTWSTAVAPPPVTPHLTFSYSCTDCLWAFAAGWVHLTCLTILPTDTLPWAHRNRAVPRWQLKTVDEVLLFQCISACQRNADVNNPKPCPWTRTSRQLCLFFFIVLFTSLFFFFAFFNLTLVHLCMSYSIKKTFVSIVEN